MRNGDLFSAPSPSPPSSSRDETFEEKVERTMEEMRRYLEKYEVLIVGWSGGKDSTATIELACQTFPEKQVYATHVHLAGSENPIFRSFLEEKAKKLEQKYPNLQVKILTPRETYWVLTIGRGYSLPHRQKRFCQRTKIDEAKKFVQQFHEDKAIQLIGIRAEEHYIRDHASKFYQPGKYAPILDWTTENVWEFLLSYCSGHEDLAGFYRDYYGHGECPYALGVLSDKELQSPKVLSTCSGRSGCWTCSLISKNKLYKELAGQGLEPLGKFMMALHDERDRPENRLPFTPTKRPRKGMGMYTLSYRETMLTRLLYLQSAVGHTLIYPWEMEEIQREWAIQIERYGEKVLRKPPWISPIWRELEEELGREGSAIQRRD